VHGTHITAPKKINLAALADKIRAARAAAVADFTRGIDRVREMGEHLKIAKQMAGHGRWGEFLRSCDLNERTTRRYIQFADLIAANRSPGTDLDGLSIKEAIKLLSPPKSPKPASAPKPPATAKAAAKGEATPGKRITHIAVIEVWFAASPADRTKAIDSIGLDAVLAALPSAWLPLIVDRIAASRAAPVNAAVIPSDLSIPEFLDRRTPPAVAADTGCASSGAGRKSNGRGIGVAGHPGNKFTTIAMEPTSDTDASGNPIFAQSREDRSRAH
jgi:hypothetical protein